MRKFEFRGKGTNGQWVKGTPLFHDGNSCTILRQHPETGGMDGVEVDPETVGQNTGLIDINEEEIYEGDILESRGNEWEPAERWLVGFRDGSFTVRCATPTRVAKYDEYALCKDEVNLFELRVIGNVFDNPELLGDEEL